jgi:hypothetical protein
MVIFGNVREEHRVVAARDFEIVVLRARPAAQGAEIEPDHPMATAHGVDVAPQYLDMPALLALFAGDHLEVIEHLLLGAGIGRVVVDLDLFQRPQAIIDAGVDLENVEMLVEQGDGRQEALSRAGRSDRACPADSWRSSR